MTLPAKIASTQETVEGSVYVLPDAEDGTSTLTFQAGSGGQGGTFVLRYTPTPPVASPVDVVVTVSGNGITHSRMITLTLPAF